MSSELRNFAIQRQDLLNDNVEIPAIKEGKGEQTMLVIDMATPYETIEGADEYNTRVFFTEGTYRVNSIDLEFLNDKAVIDYDKLTLTVQFQGETQELKIKEGDVSDEWIGITLANGDEYDLNFHQEDAEESANVDIYEVIDGKIGTSIGNFEEVTTTGNPVNYFGEPVEAVEPELVMDMEKKYFMALKQLQEYSENDLVMYAGNSYSIADELKKLV